MSVEFVEQSQRERDLSRAHWQRSVGRVVMVEMFSEFLESNPPELSELEAQVISIEVNKYHRPVTSTEAFTRAHFTTAHYFSADRFTATDRFDDTIIGQQIGEYAFFTGLHDILHEAMNTQAHFPLNLADAVSESAADESVPGFATDSLTDIAALLRRPDFQDMTLDAMLTRNGIWRTFSTSRHYSRADMDEIALGEGSALGFTFDDHGQVTFSQGFKKLLHEELSFVNKEGIKAANVARSASSGCPIRHEKPRFVGLVTDQANLDALSVAFGKSPEQLLEPRPEHIERTALNVTADLLEQAETRFSALDAVSM